MVVLKLFYFVLVLFLVILLSGDVAHGSNRGNHGRNSKGERGTSAPSNRGTSGRPSGSAAPGKKLSIKDDPDSTIKQVPKPTKKFGSAAQNAEKATITGDTAKQHTRIGGAYKDLNRHAKKNLVERDHVIPKSVYKHAKHASVRNVKEGDMPAITLPHGVHRKLVTTGNQKNKYVSKLKKQFSKGNYEGALNSIIQVYKTNPDREGKSQGKFYNTRSQTKEKKVEAGKMNEAFKQVIAQSVNIHLINKDQADRLTKRHKLNG